MDFPDISVTETECAAMRGHSVDTQQRHRRLGLGPKPFKPEGSRSWRYWLRDIHAEQNAFKAKAVA